MGIPNKCKHQHEVFFEKKVCERTCHNRFNMDPTEICKMQSQCVCADGFYRSDNNICVSGDVCDVCKINGKTYKVKCLHDKFLFSIIIPNKKKRTI